MCLYSLMSWGCCCQHVFQSAGVESIGSGLSINSLLLFTFGWCWARCTHMLFPTLEFFLPAFENQTYNSIHWHQVCFHSSDTTCGHKEKKWICCFIPLTISVLLTLDIVNCKNYVLNVGTKLLFLSHYASIRMALCNRIFSSYLPIWRCYFTYSFRC